MTGLTATQWDLLGFIARFIREHGHSPTVEQMRVHLGHASKGSVAGVVKRLEARGAIVRIPRQACSVTLTPAGTEHAEQYLNALSRETVAA